MHQDTKSVQLITVCKRSFRQDKKIHQDNKRGKGTESMCRGYGTWVSMCRGYGTWVSMCR